MTTIHSYRYAQRKAMKNAREFARQFLVAARKFVRNGYYRGNEWIAYGNHNDAVVLEQISKDEVGEFNARTHLVIATGDWFWVARVFPNPEYRPPLS